MDDQKSGVAAGSEEQQSVDADKVLDTILNNYRRLEQSMVHELYFQNEHGTTIGTFREVLWKDLFEQLVPKKFVVEQSVFIMDSNGKVSKEVDLVILDEIYTPYIFRQGHLKFIPIEAVAVAIECKSENLDATVIKKWTQSIHDLKTSDRGIARLFSHVQSKEPFKPSSEQAERSVPPQKCEVPQCLMQKKGPKPLTQTGTRPILIFCHMSNQSKDRKNVTVDLEKKFDITLWAQEKGDDRSIRVAVNDRFKELSDVYKQLNHHPYHEEEYEDAIIKNTNLDGLSLDNYRIRNGVEEVSLLTLNFMLNQALMLINNPMFFPHLAYVKLFNRRLERRLEQKEANQTKEGKS